MAGWDVPFTGVAAQSLVPFDRWGNRPPTRMLLVPSIFPREQGPASLDALNEVERPDHAGQCILQPALEDVLTNVV